MAREELRIGTWRLGGAESFGIIRQLAPLPDGGVAVLDGMAEEIRVFGAAGEYERTFGGRGAGPGELRGAQGVLLGPDGLLRVPEMGNARMSFFDPDSGFVASRRFRLYTTSSRGPWRAAQDENGRTLVWSSGPYRGGNWEMVRVYDRDLVQVDSVPYLDYTNRRPGDGAGAWLVTMPNGMIRPMTIPFNPRKHFVLDPSGEIWSSAPDETRARVIRWQPAGDTTLILEIARPPVLVTGAERDSVIATVRERFAGMPSPPRVDFGRIPRVKPTIHGLSLDEQRRLWVRVTEPTADSAVYDVFGADGRHVETILVPAAVDPDIPPIARDGVLWLVVRDETDVQYVVRARLTDVPSEKG